MVNDAAEPGPRHKTLPSFTLRNSHNLMLRCVFQVIEEN